MQREREGVREKRLGIFPFCEIISTLPIRCPWLYPVFF